MANSRNVEELLSFSPLYLKARIKELESEIESLRAQLASAKRQIVMALRLKRIRDARLKAIRDCIAQSKGDDLVRVEVEYILDSPPSEFDAATGGEEGKR